MAKKVTKNAKKHENNNKRKIIYIAISVCYNILIVSFAHMGDAQENIPHTLRPAAGKTGHLNSEISITMRLLI